jgi:hypothetical protein
MRHVLPALALTLVLAAPASADTFDVVGRGDAASPSACTAIGPQLWQCPTLRDAVDAAEATPGPDPDGILLHAGGPYVLTNGQLSITSGVTIVGESARTTVIQAGSESRVLAVGGTEGVTLANLTVQGGAPISDAGGNLLAAQGASLALVNVRVTGGTATEGGGIANSGSLVVVNSLIDHNTSVLGGGGIFNDGSGGAAADLDVVNSTIAFNQVNDGFGAGIWSAGNAGNSVALSWVTVAHNLGYGLSQSGPDDQNVSVTASIFAANGPNCSGAAFDDAQFNLDDGTSCLMDPGTNRTSTDPQLAAALSDEGGQTDVLAFQSASSPAIDYVTPCFGGIDQRGYTRVTNPASEPCDAGAFELSGIPPTEQPPEPTPTPTPPPPPPPTPTATPVPTPTATPVANRSVAADAEGTVLIKRNGKFVPLVDGVVPNGSEIDTKNGAVTITTSTGDKAKFFDGIFKISQTRGVTTLTLSEALDCKKVRRGKASAAAKKPKSRKLWGDGKGKFRTKGTYSAATVRGTKWLVQDTCTTTTTRVTQGVVQVEDFAKHKKVLVKKGKRYVARKRK